jgi:hypothetical protein
MTIIVNTIEGNKKNVCRNDAYSVVQQNNQKQTLLDIIPAYELATQNKETIRKAFEDALSTAIRPEQVKQVARRSLGLR